MTELVKVNIGKGVYMRMEKQEAIEKGLYNEPPNQKMRAPAQNKMVMPAENKAEKDDFGEIEGVGPATKKALYAGGIYTFDQLADADVSFLTPAGQRAIEKYQEELK